jgi:predicted aspartyl protease
VRRSRLPPIQILIASLFIVAGGGAVADEPPPEAVLAELPFLDSDEPNRVIVDLAPEGSAKPLRLMLDTGASHSIVTPLAARELGVQVRRTKEDPYRRPTRLGRDLLFYVDANSSDTGARTGWELGVLGGNFLAEYVVELDFPGRRVRLLDPKKYRVPVTVNQDGEGVTRLRVVQQRPAVEVSINDKKTLVLLDTGAQESAVLSGEVARRSGVASEKVPGLRSITAYGPQENEVGQVERLAIGPFELKDLLLIVAPKGWYNAGVPGDSVIGYDLLSQFTIRIDYASQRLWMKRDPSAEATLFGADVAVFRETGALLVPARKSFIALIVRPDSIAARRGMRAGDQIDGMASAEVIASMLREGRELNVIRKSDGVGVATTLAAEAEPGPVSAPPAAE